LKDLMTKVKNKILSDPKAKKVFEDYAIKKTMDFSAWNNAAGNHAFDDSPEVFGITQSEGSHIRANFQTMDSAGWEKQLVSWGIV